MADMSQQISALYLDYAVAVVTGRALPDARDGLKPVQRRILYAMSRDLKLKPGSKHRKSAAIVGRVLGAYHPHGDQSVYDAMVRMAQDFSMRYMLVDGQGNFGSIDGDNAASMRYCLTGDARVPCGRGTLPIGELAQGADVPHREQVFDGDGERVETSRYFDCGEHPVLRLRTASGYTLTGSLNHPVQCLEVGEGGPRKVWKTLEEIRVGDTALIYRGPLHRAEALAEEPGLGFLAGALVAEGSFGAGRVTFNNTDKVYFDEVVVQWDRHIGGQRYISQRELPSGKTLYELDVPNVTAFASSALSDMLGLNSYTQRIPSWVWGQGTQTRRAFLAALYEGDGSYSMPRGASSTISLSSRSQELIQQVQTLLLEFQIVSKAYEYDNGEHKLNIAARREVLRFLERVGFWRTKQQRACAQEATRTSRGGPSRDGLPESLVAWVREQEGTRPWVKGSNFQCVTRRTDMIYRGRLKQAVSEGTWRQIEPHLDAHIYYDAVELIEPAGTSRVYSLRVDTEDHAFLANGFVNHNTEARLAPMAERLLDELVYDTVEMQDNYDSTMQEPVVMPAEVPNLLMNGAQGIAVGMATNIPPHHLDELLGALIDLCDHPNLSVATLVERHVSGPDFPSGGSVVEGADAIREVYETGSGTFTMRAVWNIEDAGHGCKRIVVTELPYQVNKAKLFETCANAVVNDEIPQIKEVRDESTDDIRLVFDIKRGTEPEEALAYLLKHTSLQSRFHANFTALFSQPVHGETRLASDPDCDLVSVPKQADLKTFLNAFLDHRLRTVTRRLAHGLRKLEARIHILEGFEAAFADVDRLVVLVRSATSKADARTRVGEAFGLDEIQAEAVVAMALHRLASTEVSEILTELDNKRQEAARLRGLLDDPSRVRVLVKTELTDARRAYHDDRRTHIEQERSKAFEYSEEAYINSQNVHVILSRDGWVRAQKSYSDMSTLRCREGDEIGWSISANTRDVLVLFTSTGRAYSVRVDELEVTKGYGNPVSTMLSFGDGEVVVSAIICPFEEVPTDVHMVSLTTDGNVVRFSLEGYHEPSKVTGRLFQRVSADHSVLNVCKVSGHEEERIVVVTRDGKGISFRPGECRIFSGAGKGIRSMRLAKGDEALAFMLLGPDHPHNLTVETNRGAERMITHQTYDSQRRGGKGFTLLKRGHLTVWHPPVIEV